MIFTITPKGVLMNKLKDTVYDFFKNLSEYVKMFFDAVSAGAITLWQNFKAALDNEQKITIKNKRNYHDDRCIPDSKKKSTTRCSGKKPTEILKNQDALKKNVWRHMNHH